MNEQVKEHIRSVVRTNGAGLINGQNLQDVLIEMVDGVVPESSSYATEAGKVTYKLRISGSGVDAEYDGSQDVTASLENYPDREEVTEEVNESTASIKGWVEDKQYLTSASLSGLATEEFVDEKISEATASIKDWVGEQGYATTESLTHLSESVAESIENIDLSEYATTASVLEVSESVNELSSSVSETLDSYATTQSVNELSQSVAEDFANLDIPDISGLATTASVNELSSSVGAALDTLATTQSLNLLSASVATDFENLHINDYAKKTEVTSSINEATGSVKGWVTDQHYLTEHQSLAGLFDSASYSSDDKKIYFYDKSKTQVGEINATDFIKDGMVDGVSIDTGSNQLVITFNTDAGKEDITLDLNQIFNPNNYYIKSEVDTIATASVSQSQAWVEEQGFLTEHQDISGLATTASVNLLSASIAQDIDNIDIPDISGLATTASVNELSSSVSTTLGKYATTQSVNELSASIASDFENLPKVDLSGYATTASVNAATESVKTWVGEQGYLTEHQDISGLATTASVNQLSASIAQDFDNLDIPDISGLQTTASFNTYSSSIGVISASFDQRIENIPTGSGLWEAGTGEGSIVQPGFDNTATGNGSIATGYTTTASGEWSHAEGVGTVASGINSHAEGVDTVASGNWSHAEGAGTTASGDLSHAEGDHTKALGLASYAEGYNTIASNDYEHAQGRYNATASSQIFSVGAGDDDSRRKNAISVITGSGEVPSASVYVYGVGGYDGTNPQPGTNDLATIVNAGGGGVDTDLRSFLFDSQSVTVTSLDCTKTNLYSSINTDVTLGINTYPAAGRSVALTVRNTDTSNSHSVTIPDVLGTYDVYCNGGTSGSLVIPAGEVGDMVITEMGGELYIRTSLGVTIGGGSGPDLSGYVTTQSFNPVSQSVYNQASMYPSGSYTRETWLFTLTDSSSVTKTILVG